MGTVVVVEEMDWDVLSLVIKNIGFRGRFPK